MKRRLALCLFALSTLSAPSIATGQTPPMVSVRPQNPQGPALPQGPLLGVSASKNGGAFFIVQDTVVRTGPSVDYWVYLAIVPPADLGGGRMMVQSMLHQTIDCETQTFTRLASFAYGEDGKQITSLPAEPPVKIEPGMSSFFQYKVLCENVQLPARNTLQGSTAALAMARQILR